MARQTNWTDDYWVLLLQLYLRKPEGVKPKYSPQMVELSIELHIHPDELYKRMKQLDNVSHPSLERLWDTYAWNPRKLSRVSSLLRQMHGFGNSELFYDGVETVETFEQDFRRLSVEPQLKPVMLVMILELYFRLTPITMVSDTPEVQEVAKLLKIRPSLVVDVLDAFQGCDPYLNQHEMTFSTLTMDCMKIWQRYANMPQAKLIAYAEELKAYFG